MRRVLVAKGRHYDVEYAVRADLTRPAETYLHDLRSMMWEGDAEAETLPDDAQLSQYHRFLDMCLHLASTGTPRRRSDVNYLRDGVWEFRAYNKRLSWFDTPGDGSCDYKARITDVADADDPGDDFWWFPIFDEFLRLGHGFAKSEQLTDPADLALAGLVRDEDLTHDR